MNTKKILLGGIAGGVAFFLFGWLVYGILMKDFMAANLNQCMMKPEEEMGMGAMIVSNLSLGFILALIIGWSKTSGAVSGLKIGGIVGLLFAINLDMMFYAMTTMFSNFTAIVTDIAIFTVMSAVGGAIVGWVMGMGKKEG